jgi:protein ImuB
VSNSVSISHQHATRSQRILCLWLPRLLTDRIARPSREVREHAEGEIPHAVFGKRSNADILIAVDAAAEELGLSPGIALAEARAMYPYLDAIPEDPDADAKLLTAIADWCQRYTPLVAENPPDGVLLDISGCAHLFGGEAALRDDLVMRMRRHGFSARAAVAGTIGAAWAATHFSEATHVDSGGERELLSPLPLGALRLPHAMAAMLARLGLKRIGDILDLPRAPLAARFGDALLRQLDRALGREAEPLTPRLPVPPYFAEQPFAEPIAREEDVLAVTERLAGRLVTMLERRGEGARRIELCLFRTDGAVRHVTAGTSRPIRDPRAIKALFIERLAALGDAIDPGFGFDLARLSVHAAEPLTPMQTGFGGDARETAVDDLVDRLAARLGPRRIGRLLAQDTHIPELASLTLPAQSHRTMEDAGWGAFRTFRESVELAPRPLRLLATPEPISVTPTVIDTHPKKFRWRRAWHQVIAADGPERIEAMWWTAPDDGPTRDYFRVQDDTGLRFWLFRSKLWNEEEERFRLSWFMHGLFA